MCEKNTDKENGFFQVLARVVPAENIIPCGDVDVTGRNFLGELTSAEIENTDFVGMGVKVMHSDKNFYLGRVTEKLIGIDGTLSMWLEFPPIMKGKALGRGAADIETTRALRARLIDLIESGQASAVSICHRPLRTEHMEDGSVRVPRIVEEVSIVDVPGLDSPILASRWATTSFFKDDDEYRKFPTETFLTQHVDINEGASTNSEEEKIDRENMSANNNNTTATGTSAASTTAPASSTTGGNAPAAAAAAATVSGVKDYGKSNTLDVASLIIKVQEKDAEIAALREKAKRADDMEGVYKELVTMKEEKVAENKKRAYEIVTGGYENYKRDAKAIRYTDEEDEKAHEHDIEVVEKVQPEFIDKIKSIVDKADINGNIPNMSLHEFVGVMETLQFPMAAYAQERARSIRELQRQSNALLKNRGDELVANASRSVPNTSMLSVAQPSSSIPASAAASSQKSVPQAATPSTKITANPFPAYKPPNANALAQALSKYN